MFKLVFIHSFLIISFSLSAQKNLPQNAIKHLPNITLYNLEGASFNLKSITENKVTIIEFWFLPCPPCFIQMNSFHHLYSKLKGNPNLIFLTISRTDSSSVKPLLQNDTTGNDSFNYYKSLSKLNHFYLPTYFIKGCDEKLEYFRMTGNYQYVTSMLKPQDNSQCPDSLFNFTHYPTLLVFDKKGDLIYNRTGFYGYHVIKEFKEMKKVILSHQ
jgi:thiol-disulfide isomerase/thioredoxin